MPKVDIDIDKRIFNSVYLPYLYDETPVQILFGGSSSGKSVFLIGQRMIIDLLNGKRNYLVIRNVARTLRDSVFNEALQGIDRLKVGGLFKTNLTDMTITCVNGCQAILKGLDDVQKIKSIRPRNGVITDLLIEEAWETSYDDVKELEKRMRGLSDVPKRITYLFNPISRAHWIYKHYFAGNFSDTDTKYKTDYISILKTTYKDNKFLAPDDIFRLEDEKDKFYYDVYTLGNWGVLGKLVFDNWETRDLTDLLPEFDNHRNGLDFGFTNDPSALSRSSIRGRTLYLTDEMYEYGLTNPMIADRIKPIIGQEIVYCDSAEPKSIYELMQYKINAMHCMKGKDSVNHGIQWLKRYDIVIHSKLQNTINNFSLFQWKKNIEGIYLNVPVNKDKHIPDAVRYAYSTEMFMPQISGVASLGDFLPKDGNEMPASRSFNLNDM